MRLLLIALLFLPGALMAQDNGGSGSGGEGGGSQTITPTRVTSAAEVVVRLNNIAGLCGNAGAYAVDCIAERVAALETDMAGLAGYGDLRQVLRDTASGLHRVARNNRDPLQPRARLSSPDGGPHSSRPLVAIAPQRRATAAAQAIAILEEAETKLLRSPASGAATSAYYQQVAAALGSNKVLLRSA